MNASVVRCLLSLQLCGECFVIMGRVEVLICGWHLAVSHDSQRCHRSAARPVQPLAWWTWLWADANEGKVSKTFLKFPSRDPSHEFCTRDTAFEFVVCIWNVFFFLIIFVRVVFYKILYIDFWISYVFLDIKIGSIVFFSFSVFGRVIVYEVLFVYKMLYINIWISYVVCVIKTHSIILSLFLRDLPFMTFCLRRILL